MNLKEEFLKHLCQTSEEPVGIEVDRAHGCLVVDRNGKISILYRASGGKRWPYEFSGRRAICDQQTSSSCNGVSSKASNHACETVTERAPAIMVVYFTNSGTEAVEGALKAAKKHKRQKLWPLRAAFMATRLVRFP
jgi:acetylornithine/succinyldiaminopimelate/putrescine aminotransferase